MDEYSAWAARWRVPLGFALAFAYVILCQPTPPWLVAGFTVALLGLVVRGWAAGFLDKNQSLATGGPYRYTRNPLYLGSAVTGVGLAIAGGSVVMLLAFASLFLLVYGPVMRREEHFLRRKFGAAYDGYSATVPLLLPGRQAGPASDQRFRWVRYRKNREYEAALGFSAALVFLILKMRLR
jgi:protein-S-isoprenylcysteine O-methyltransferase Ste14